MSKKAAAEPRVALPQTAQRLVDGARRVVLAKGYAGLTLDAVDAEAGLNKSLVRYYFGGKAGLVGALVDSLFPEQGHLQEALLQASPGEEQVRALLAQQRGVSADDDVNRLLYELLPHILRDKELRRRFARSYRESRRLDVSCMEAGAPGIDVARAERLAALSVAVLEGLAMQREIDPKGLDFDGAFEEWEQMLTAYLAGLVHE